MPGELKCSLTCVFYMMSTPLYPGVNLQLLLKEGSRSQRRETSQQPVKKTESTYSEGPPWLVCGLSGYPLHLCLPASGSRQLCPSGFLLFHLQ
jgi:hypothetical protein